MPKISVIVPVYNVEPYLKRCVNSILEQTYSDFELILIDDESPDGCPAICDEYAENDPRVIVIHKKNGGVSAARNSGLDVAKGEYIAFCDSDDWWDLDFLNVLILNAQITSADMVSCNFQEINSNGEIYRKSKKWVGQYELVSDEEKVNYMISNILCDRNGWEIWTRLFKNNLIQQYHIRFCTSCENYAEDLGFTLVYCLFAKRVICLEYCGYFYYLRSNSMMAKSETVVKLNDMNEVSKFVYNFAKTLLSENIMLNYFPIIHFLIMRVEYGKLVGSSEYDELAFQLSQIVDSDYYRSQCKSFWKTYPRLVVFFGKSLSRMYCLLNHFCIHRNVSRFNIESAIAFRIFIKGE